MLRAARVAHPGRMLPNPGGPIVGQKLLPARGQMRITRSARIQRA
jgi:hypothetical protein